MRGYNQNYMDITTSLQPPLLAEC